MPRSGYVVLVLVTISLLDGCGSATPPLLQGSIKADPATNPDLNGRASPLVLRVYELRSPDAFSGADFFSLFDKESETLGGDLLGREEYDLRPAETRPYRRQLQPDTKFIGVVAAFRDLENSRWRQVAPVPAKRQSTIAIGLEARAVTVTVVPGGFSFFTKDSSLPSKDSVLPSKDSVLPSKDSVLPSKDSLLAQANGMVADLVSLNSSGKLTPEQVMQVGQLLPKAAALKGELETANVDPLQLSQLASNLVDLLKQVGALKALVK